MNKLFPLLLILPLVATPLLEMSSTPEGYSVGATLVYNVTVYSYYPNVSVTNLIYIMRVTSFINDSFVNTSLTVINPEIRTVLPPIYSAGNATAPPLFFYISPSLLGEKVIWRGGNPLYLNMSNSTGYLYYSESPFLQGEKVYFYMFVLKNGTVTWVMTKQVAPDGRTVSVTVDRLWLTNYSGTVHLNLTGYMVLKKGIDFAQVFNDAVSLALVIGVAVTIPLGYYLNRKGYLK